MRWMTALAAVLVLVSVDAEAAKGKKKKVTSVAGTVTSVKSDKNGGTLTVSVKAKGKKNAGKPAQEKTFTLSSSTTIEKAGKKVKGQGKPTATAAKIEDLKAGSVVTVKSSGDQVKGVTISAKKAKKAKKTKATE